MGLVRTFRGLIKPTSFDIIPSSASIKVGSTYEIPYEIVPDNSTNQKINWSSSNTNIATVSNGIVTPVDEGTVTITGITDYLGFTDTISIEITVVPVTGISLNESSITVNAGETFQLEATITPADAGDQRVTWSSSNTSVATVSSNGLVTYVGDGNATITVTTNDGGYTASCSVACVSFVPVDTCFGYTGTVQSILLQPHTYCFEVWGASGGSASAHGCAAGKGGYSAGTYTVSGGDKTLYIYVGGQGGTGTYPMVGGWNGGGGVMNPTSSTGSAANGAHSATGGGATDISTSCSSMTLDACCRCRKSSYGYEIIVAGGGGGAESAVGGAGGGICGCPSSYGGTQSAAGTITCYSISNWAIGYAGGRGYGMSVTATHSNHAGGAGGGGGYYGGGGCVYNGSGGYGGGGSGYIGGVSDGVSCAGNSSFPSPSGGTETGHTGYGCVRIRSL